MSSSSDSEAAFTPEQRAGLESRRTDQDRTLAAIHELEEALESAAPGREAPWRDRVISALKVLDEATAAEGENAARADSLLSDVARTQPRLRNRVRGLRIRYRQLQDAIAALRRELDDAGEAPPDFADLRQRAGWLLTALRHQRARESDFIYEAYYDAFKADLGERPDRDWPPPDA
jgi:DNA repair ATPase RecN